MSGSLQPDGLQSSRLLCPWDFPGKNTGAGEHFLLQGNLPDLGVERAWQVDGFFTTHPPEKSIKLLEQLFSHSVVSDSLRPQGLQHARPPCPSPTLRVYSHSVYWVSDAIQPSHRLLSPSPPPSIFPNESVLCIRWPKFGVLLQHQSFQWIFRTDLL